MAIEAARSCGFRKVGGLYLCGEGASTKCDRLPYEIENCPTCGSGLKFTRAWTWLNWLQYAGNHECECKEASTHMLTFVTPPLPSSGPCSVCWPYDKLQPYGLLWVGEKYYSPDAFVRESIQQGVSRRLPFKGSVPRIPKLLKLGQTWVLFAHIHVIKKGLDEHNQEIWAPAIFHAFKPTRLELLLWGSEATPERLEELEKAGVTPIVIPDGDKDHDPSTPLGLPKAEKEELEEKVLFSDMRARLGRS